MSVHHLDRLFAPASVAVFGATARAAAPGATVWRNLRAGGFAGRLFAVNPKHATLDGEKCYARCADLPLVPELAIVCTPPATLPRLVAELAAAGVGAAVLLSTGLTAAQRQAVREAARPAGLRLLGPESIGTMSPATGLNASVSPTEAVPGHVALVSQSGSLVTSVLDWARSRGIGFSHVVSLGEQCDVDVADLLDHLAAEPATRAILLYLEAVSAPRRFMSAARRAARNKPVIVVKAGRAGQGVQAAASHTGVLAGADRVHDAAIRRAGLLRVDTLQELFLAAETLAHFAANRSPALTIVTNGGGAGVMAADAAAREPVPLAELTPALRARLDAVLPAGWSGANPVDIVGDAPAERHAAALGALLADDAAGAVLFIHAPTAVVPSDEIAQACLPLVRAAPARVMGCWLGDATVASARRRFEDAGVPVYPTPEDAVHAFALLQTYRRNQATLLETPDPSENPPPDLESARRVFRSALEQHREWLTEHETQTVLEAYGVPVVRTLSVPPTADAAVAAARETGYPVALKIESPQVTHKSDVGGVQLDIGSDAALADAAAAMLARVRKARPDAQVTAFTVQAMIHRPRSHELIVGASIDAVFGPVVLFGQGGGAVQVSDDHALALPPLNRSLAAELVSRTRVARLLAGYRDRPPADFDALHDVLIAVSQMLADLPHLAELDINPLWLDERGALALDARLRVSATPVAGAERFAISPYPARWVRQERWNGQLLTVRPIRPEDEPQHRRFIHRMAAEDLRLRFFNPRRDFGHDELARLTQIDYDREMAFIAEVTAADGTRETLGVARAVADPDNVEAEFAVVVRSDLKGLGLGRLLLQRLEDYLRSRGTRQIAGLVLTENQAMLALTRAMGFSTRPGDGSNTVWMIKSLR